MRCGVSRGSARGSRCCGGGGAVEAAREEEWREVERGGRHGAHSTGGIEDDATKEKKRKEKKIGGSLHCSRKYFVLLNADTIRYHTWDYFGSPVREISTDRQALYKVSFFLCMRLDSDWHLGLT